MCKGFPNMTSSVPARNIKQNPESRKLIYMHKCAIINGRTLALTKTMTLPDKYIFSETYIKTSKDRYTLNNV